MVVRQFCYDYSGMYVNQMETYSLLLAMHTERENLLHDIAGSELVVSQLRALLKLNNASGSEGRGAFDTVLRDIQTFDTCLGELHKAVAEGAEL